VNNFDVPRHNVNRACGVKSYGENLKIKSSFINVRGLKRAQLVQRPEIGSIWRGAF